MSSAAYALLLPVGTGPRLSISWTRCRSTRVASRQSVVSSGSRYRCPRMMTSIQYCLPRFHNAMSKLPRDDDDDTSAFVQSTRFAIGAEEFVEVSWQVPNRAPKLHEDRPALLMAPRTERRDLEAETQRSVGFGQWCAGG